MKCGFALIDLLVSIMISSIMSTVLFTMIFQMQKSENGINEVVSTSMQAVLVYERLQKDLTGLFWPQFMPDVDLKKTEAKDDTKKEQKQEPKKIVGPKIPKILYSQNTSHDGQEILKEFSFITSNPLQVYNESKPRVVRVIYTLEPEIEHAGSFELKRQEGLELDYEAVKKNTPAFVIISGIKSLKLTYFYQDRTSELEDDIGDQPNLIKQNELDYGQSDDSVISSDSKSLIGQVPSYIKVYLSLWNEVDQQDFKEFEFWFYINMPVKKNQEKTQKK